MPREAVIVEAVRTPIGKRGGALKDVRADDLAAVVLQEGPGQVVGHGGIGRVHGEGLLVRREGRVQGALGEAGVSQVHERPREARAEAEGPGELARRRLVLALTVVGDAEVVVLLGRQRIGRAGRHGDAAGGQASRREQEKARQAGGDHLTAAR